MGRSFSNKHLVSSMKSRCIDLDFNPFPLTSSEVFATSGPAPSLKIYLLQSPTAVVGDLGSKQPGSSLHQSLHKSTHSSSVFGGQKLAVYAFCLREYTENCQQSAKNSDSRPGCYVQVFWNDCTCTSITANYIPKIPKVVRSCWKFLSPTLTYQQDIRAPKTSKMQIQLILFPPLQGSIFPSPTTLSKSLFCITT